MRLPVRRLSGQSARRSADGSDALVIRAERPIMTAALPRRSLGPRDRGFRCRDRCTPADEDATWPAGSGADVSACGFAALVALGRSISHVK
jgi:hypothetical protein